MGYRLEMGRVHAQLDSAQVVQGQALGLATSPASASLTTPFAVLPGELFDLAQVDTNQQQPVAGLRYITYAG